MKNVTFIFLLLSTLTFAQSSNMTLLSNWDGSSMNYNDVWGYTDDYDNEYAIIGSRTHTYFVDVTDPNTPVLVASFDGSFSSAGISGSNTTWRDFKTYKRYAYGVCDGCNEGLAIFDLTDIANGVVTKVNQDNSLFGACHNIYVDVPNDRLYAVGTNTLGSGVYIYDLATDPTDPTLLASTPVDGGYIHDIFVQNNIGYCSSAFAGMYIIDFSVPTSPVTIAFLDTGGYNHSSWIYEDGTKILYAEEVPAGRPLGILDITNANNNDLTILNTFRDPLLTNVSNITYHNPYILGDFVVVSSYNDGITIFDIADPMNPTLVGYYDTFPSNTTYSPAYEGSWGTYPFLPSGNILASDISTGLYVLSTTVGMSSECGNGVQDEFERGVDCGGFCKPCATCDDGILNGDETEVDCGGSTCEPCSCDEDIVIPESTTMSDTVYNSTTYIHSAATIPAGVSVTYNAAEIELLASFEVQMNADFSLNIDPCTLPGVNTTDVTSTPTSATTTVSAPTPKSHFDVVLFPETELLYISAQVADTTKEAAFVLLTEKGSSMPLKVLPIHKGASNVHKIPLKELSITSETILEVQLYLDHTVQKKQVKRTEMPK